MLVVLVFFFDQQHQQQHQQHHHLHGGSNNGHGHSGGGHGLGGSAAGASVGDLATRRSLDLMRIRATDPRPCPQCGAFTESVNATGLRGAEGLVLKGSTTPLAGPLSTLNPVWLELQFPAL